MTQCNLSSSVSFISLWKKNEPCSWIWVSLFWDQLTELQAVYVRAVRYRNLFVVWSAVTLLAYRKVEHLSTFTSLVVNIWRTQTPKYWTAYRLLCDVLFQSWKSSFWTCFKCQWILNEVFWLLDQSRSVLVSLQLLCSSATPQIEIMTLTENTLKTNLKMLKVYLVISGCFYFLWEEDELMGDFCPRHDGQLLVCWSKTWDRSNWLWCLLLVLNWF